MLLRGKDISGSIVTFAAKIPTLPDALTLQIVTKRNNVTTILNSIFMCDFKALICC